MEIQCEHKLARLGGVIVKTIMKMYADGDFEAVDTPLIQSGISGDYKFTENNIVVPKIIEYPPIGYRNYFIEKTSVSGYLSQSQEGIVLPATEHDRSSDFINVEDWTTATIRVRFEDISGEYEPWIGVVFYDENKRFVSYPVNSFTGVRNGNYLYEVEIPTNTYFLRISMTYYDNPDTSVKVSVEKGETTNTKHYLAFEDMPEWVKDTGNPISIFKEGVVIKGEII